MGKRKRGNGCKENESGNGQSIFSEDQQGMECRKQLLSSDVSETTDFQSNVSLSSLLLEPIEITNANDEIMTPAADARPTLQLRSSARVQNKRKEENRCELFNDNLMKKTDNCSQDEDEDELVKPELADGEGKKRRRAWEVWSMKQKDCFFEGINEFGKDFEAIQNSLLTKMKKKGNDNYAPKNKDQVRFFYYRTWNKISKHVVFNSDVIKSTQELYALINYGELRRKVGGTLDEKKGQKLQELIEKGSASIRRKGRNIRVRTPICRALKKLNQFTSDEEDYFRVPFFITVSLSAGNIESWSHVQSCAHNPRVRIKCPLHKQLSSIFSLFEHKWRRQEVKLCESMVSSLALPMDVPTPNPLTLRLRPQSDADIKIASIQADTQMTSSQVSLASHEQYLVNNMLKTVATHRKVRKRKTDSNKFPENRLEMEIDSQDDGSDGELDCRNKSPTSQGDLLTNDSEYQVDNTISQSETACDNATDRASDTESGIFESSVDVEVKNEPVSSPIFVTETGDIQEGLVVKQENDALRQLMALQNVVNPHDDDGDVVFVGENTRLLGQIRDQAKTDAHEIAEIEIGAASSDEEESEKATNEVLTNSVEQIRKGWTSSTCGSMKIGELYLMFGKKKTLSLEYIFEDCNTFSLKIPFETVATESPVEIIDDKKMETAADQEQNTIPTDQSESDCVRESPTYSETEMILKTKREIARKEFSDVLERLVTMVKSFGSKTSTSDCFFCGTSKSSAAVKSPSNSRNSSYGRSPSHARSPRLPGNSKSPKNAQAISKVNDEKTKPSSAKRLLACIPEEKEENDGSSKSTVELASNLNITVEIPIQPKISIESSGNFRVPLAPAPRVTNSNSGFNAQLSKLLPKYSRPRITNRKNMYVQRQLPLLPTTSNKSQRYITLKVLPTPMGGSLTSIHSDSISPKIPNQVMPVNNAVSSSNPVTNSSISMPIICPTTPPSSAISVNVSGQQLLTIEMPTFTAASPCSNVIPTEPSNQTPVVIGDGTETITSRVAADASAFKGEDIVSYDVDTVLSKQACYPLDMSTPPSTPLSQTSFGQDIKFSQAITCSTPTLPELRDISFLELTPFNSPSKSKFSLSPLNLLSDSSNLSILNSPKQLDSKSICVSPIKLNLSAILNAATCNRIDAQEATEPTLPFISIPDIADGLLESSNFGRISICQPQSLGTASTSNADHSRPATVDDKIINGTAKLMDITFSNSNSNSNFSTLLAAVGQPILETDSCDTLQTPPRVAKTQPTGVGKNNATAPLGLSFKANLFASDYQSTLPTTTPSPPSSPSRLLQQSDNSQWLNNEMNDFSLSTILSHLESPAKSSNSQKVMTKEDSCSLSCFLNDNSVDFAATFAKFKAQIAKDNPNE